MTAWRRGLPIPALTGNEPLSPFCAQRLAMASMRSTTPPYLRAGPLPSTSSFSLRTLHSLASSASCASFSGSWPALAPWRRWSSRTSWRFQAAGSSPGRRSRCIRGPLSQDITLPQVALVSSRGMVSHCVRRLSGSGLLGGFARLGLGASSIERASPNTLSWRQDAASPRPPPS